MSTPYCRISDKISTSETALTAQEFQLIKIFRKLSCEDKNRIIEICKIF